jgi:PIN like domain
MLPETPRPTVFIDRNSGGRLFKALIEAEGIPVVLHDECFPDTTEDHEWLAKLGASGWLLVTGDDDTTRTPLFLHQLAESRAHVFMLRGLNSGSREDKARCIVEAYPKMCALASSNEPPKFWRVGKEDGVARAFDFRATLAKMNQKRRR